MVVFWVKNLMGFKPSPYNSVRMQLIAEEIIRGNRLDLENSFQWQWQDARLNLPGSVGYDPNEAWSSK